MGDFLTRLGVNHLNHKLRVRKGGILVDIGNVSGSFTSTGSFGKVEATSFSGDGTNITGVTAEWDGTHTGNGVITGDFDVSGDISGSSTSTGSFGRVSTSTLDLSSIQGNWTNAGNTIADLGSVTTVDINGGTVDSITSLTAANNLDIGAYDLRAQTLTADGLTSGRVVYAGTNGVLSDDSDLTFSGATLSATNITTTGTIKDFSVASGSATSTGSFGRIDTTGDIYASGRLYEAGSSVVDHGTAMAIVFGG